MKEFLSIDIIEINDLKAKMKECIEKDHWFEISSDSAKLLYDYIDSIEESYKYLYNEYQK